MLHDCLKRCAFRSFLIFFNQLSGKQDQCCFISVRLGRITFQDWFDYHLQKLAITLLMIFSEIDINLENLTLHLYRLQNKTGKFFIKEKDVRGGSQRKSKLIKTQLGPVRMERMVFQEAHSSPCSLLK